MIDQEDLLHASMSIEDMQDSLETIYGHCIVALKRGDEKSMKAALEFCMSEADEFVYSLEDSRIDLEYINERFEAGKVSLR